jgi:hypothetical protein
MDGAESARRSWAWIAAPFIAVFLAAGASSADLRRASVALVVLAVVGLFIASCVLAITPGVAVLSLAARYRTLGPATGLGLLFAGAATAGMAGFWAWFASPDLGRAFDLVLFTASIVTIGLYGRQGELRRLGLSLPLLLALAVGLLYIGIAFLQGGIAGEAWRTIEARYWLAQDNEIPFLFARRVAAAGPLHGYLLGNWQSSDRPPLQTGFVLLQWPLWGYRGDAYQILSGGLQDAWLPALWVVLRVRGLSVRPLLAVVLAAAATGAVFFNSIYVWPKMLAGALALAAFAILVSRSASDRWPGAGVLVACLATLSMLAHGGTVFAVLAMAPFAYLFRRRITLGAAAACTGAALALYLPWVLYQRFVDPPGNRLLKWQLAGVIKVDKRGFLQALIQQYASLSPRQLLDNKWFNLATVVANPTVFRARIADPGWHGFVGLARVAQLDDMVLAAGPLLLGALALLIPSARRNLAQFKPLATFTGLAVILWVVLLFGGQSANASIQEGPYAAVVLFVGLCALAVTALPRAIAYTVLAANAAWFAICWMPGFGFHQALAQPMGNQHTNPAMAWVCILALIALAAICAVAVRQPLGGELQTAAASAGDPTMAATDGEAAGQAIDSPA